MSIPLHYRVEPLVDIHTAGCPHLTRRLNLLVFVATGTRSVAHTATQRQLQNCPHLLDSKLPLGTRGYARAHFKMLLDEHQRDLSHRRDDGASLLHFVARIPVVLNHLPETAHLTRETV